MRVTNYTHPLGSLEPGRVAKPLCGPEPMPLVHTRTFLSKKGSTMNRYAIATTDDCENLMIVCEVHMTPSEESETLMHVVAAYAPDVYSGKRDALTFDDHRVCAVLARTLGQLEGKRFFPINIRAGAE
jgi:hypothetical protein